MNHALDDFDYKHVQTYEDALAYLTQYQRPALVHLARHNMAADRFRERVLRSCGRLGQTSVPPLFDDFLNSVAIQLYVAEVVLGLSHSLDDVEDRVLDHLSFIVAGFYSHIPARNLVDQLVMAFR